jgi:hypothetical protein
MKRIQLIALASALSATFALPARAQTEDAQQTDREAAPIQLSLWSPVQTSDVQRSVHGMRLNLLYGKNRDVHGFDLGIANHATGHLYGLQLGLGGYVENDVHGVQYNAILSIAHGNVLGVQEGIYASAGTLSGVQIGAVNHVAGAAMGARFAIVNVSGLHTEGAEFGFVNHSRRIDGLQLGLVNVAEELHGVQIGVANVAKNGFLPFFPVVNAAM